MVSTHYTHYHSGNTQDVRPRHRGGLALIGGGADVDSAFRYLIDRGGGGDFLVLRGSGADGYQDYVSELGGANSVETLVLHDHEAASDPFVLERIERADAIFLAGGDQWNYVGKWKGTPLLEALNRALLNGVPMGGTSAGLAVLGEHVFTAERDTITSQQAMADPYHPALTLESDFLKAPALEGVITDSHFSQRERMGRLVSFMSRLEPSTVGIGVDEATAVLVDGHGHGDVVGEGAAYFVRGDGPPEHCLPGEPLTFEGLHGYRVEAGQHLDLPQWTSDGTPLAVSVREGTLVD